MTFNPKTLRDLGAFWVSKGGVNLGVVGNKAHTIGYHLGKDRIFDGRGPGIGARDYSVQEARDKAGLTDAASAIDLGKLNGSLEELYAFSRWLVAECQAKKRGTRDVREVIYSPDGVKVQRYSGVDGQIHTGEGNGDASHINHTHISYFRDSENRDKASVFAPYFVEEPVLNFTWIKDQLDSVPGTVTVRGDGHSAILADGTLYPLPAGAEKHSYGLVRFKSGPRPGELAYAVGDDCAFLLKADVVFVAAGTCADKVAAARERDRLAHIANIEEVYSA